MLRCCVCTVYSLESSPCHKNSEEMEAASVLLEYVQQVSAWEILAVAVAVCGVFAVFKLIAATRFTPTHFPHTPQAGDPKSPVRAFPSASCTLLR